MKSPISITSVAKSPKPVFARPTRNGRRERDLAPEARFATEAVFEAPFVSAFSPPNAVVDDALVVDTFVEGASVDEVLRDTGLRGDGLLAAVLRDEVPADVLDGDALDGDVLDDDLFVDEALVEDALGMDCATLLFPHDVHGSGPSLAEGVTCRLDSGSTMPD
jgi:hypothetical protein